MSDFTAELAKLHNLSGADFSRQVEKIALRKEFHPLDTDKDIYSVGGEVANSLEDSIGQCNRILLNLTIEYNTRSLAFAIKRYFEINQDAIEVLIFKGGKHISVDRTIAMRDGFLFRFKKFYER